MTASDTRRVVRCAVYARKSTEDPWEVEYNSIESQHDICSAYITCQHHKRWVEQPQAYDDAGKSGGNLDRPALQRLLRDIECGEIDVVVIYKIDRLTRSLADFIRLIEILDRHEVKFVSVTQAFDTSDSMGRLVLNILLTFAQFERELISDRIRDKVDAMRRRGKRGGGPPPFGYDVVDRKLVVNPVEARRVAWMFQRLIELGSSRAVYRELEAQGMRTRIHVSRSGKSKGGGPISHGCVHYILGNPVYVGLVAHKGVTYPGEHEAIIDEKTWDAALAVRARRSQREAKLRASENFLRGILQDAHGRRMVMAATGSKAGQRYRYYVSEQSRWAARDGIKRYSIRAEHLEALVLAAVKEVLNDREKTRAALLEIGRRGEDLARLPRRASFACSHLDDADVERLREILASLIVNGEISQNSLVLVFRSSEVVRFLAWDGIGHFEGDRASWTASEPTFMIRRPLDEVIRERRLAFPVEPIASERRRRPRLSLVRLIHTARRAQAAVDAERDTSVDALARRFGMRSHRFCRILRLNYLAPDIVAAILSGAHPDRLTRNDLLRGTLPLDWDLQRQMFGFPARPDYALYAPRDERDAFLSRAKPDRQPTAETTLAQRA